MRLLFSALLTFTLATPVLSRPVSYLGGVTSYVMHDAKETSTLLHYTVDPKASIGLRSIARDGLRTTINALEVNYLVKRKNGENHQANFYLRGGLGLASIDSPSRHAIFTPTNPATYFGMATDWENRRFFLSYENKYEKIFNHGETFSQSARVGIAPYIADYGKLHTWLMLEVNHHPHAKNGDYSIRPLVRLFKGKHLLEVGIDNHKDVMVNWIGRY